MEKIAAIAKEKAGLFLENSLAVFGFFERLGQ
ncbi:hypothetical protein B3286c1_0989 [Brucella vulpis]|nr:hypothetical protein BF3285c1_0990 [Brucella vulpis]CUW49818.1 hypothetical protein B3286c1_0989 [Brucella vulpis]